MSLYAGEFYLCGRKTFVCFSKMTFSAACSAGFRACPRPCDDRLRFCDSETPEEEKDAGPRPCDDRLRFCDPTFLNFLVDNFDKARPCDDRLRFCDSNYQPPNHTPVSFLLDLVMTACGFVTDHSGYH